MEPLRIGVIGDFNPEYPLHPATNEAIAHCVDGGGRKLRVEWLATDREHDLSGFHGLLCSPGSPYRSLGGALAMVRWARVNGVPFLGTCGGFQHAVLEFARNVMRIEDATHAEYDPYASVLFVTRLACSLVGQTLEIQLKPGTLAAEIYSGPNAMEQYYCNFGLDFRYGTALEAAGMRISGTDASGEARIVELGGHPFFLATLFVPQAKSTVEHPHPVVRAFVTAAMGRAGVAAGAAR